MPTPQENAAALVARVAQVREEALAAQAARRARALAALAPLTDALDALAQALRDRGGDLGTLTREAAALAPDGAFRMRYDLRRADGDARKVLLRFATTEDGDEVLRIGRLGRALADSLASQGVAAADEAHPVSDEAAFAPADAPRVADILDALLEGDLSAQGW